MKFTIGPRVCRTCGVWFIGNPGVNRCNRCIKDRVKRYFRKAWERQKEWSVPE